MLSPTDKIRVINILDTTLGMGTHMKDNERAHYCPFCGHHKKKLQISLESGVFHCWVCDAKGRRIVNLLNKLDISPSDLITIKRIYRDNGATYKPSKDDKTVILKLPKEFISLSTTQNRINPLYINALFQTKKRGISMSDIIKNNIGYCEEGM